MEKFCKHCQKRFNAKYPETIYCSMACSKFRFKVRANEKAKADKEKREQENAKPSCPQFKLTEGGLFNSIKRVQRTQDLLTFTQSIFWLEKTFSEEEQLRLKLLIAEHFHGSTDVDRTFKELIARTCLTKQWVDEKPYRTILEPAEWFDVNSAEGLDSAEGLYNKILTQRTTIPSYQYGITIITEAILKYFEKKNVLDIYSYRKQFIKLHRMDLLQIYFNAIIHIQFINL